MAKIGQYTVIGNSKPMIVVGRTQFYLGLIMAFILIIVGGYEINNNISIGSGVLGFGLAMGLLLLEQSINSIGRIK